VLLHVNNNTCPCVRTLLPGTAALGPKTVMLLPPAVLVGTPTTRQLVTGAPPSKVGGPTKTSTERCPPGDTPVMAGAPGSLQGQQPLGQIASALACLAVSSSDGQPKTSPWTLSAAPKGCEAVGRTAQACSRRVASPGNACVIHANLVLSFLEVELSLHATGGQAGAHA
jgi:hypothetical protein